MSLNVNRCHFGVRRVDAALDGVTPNQSKAASSRRTPKPTPTTSTCSIRPGPAHAHGAELLGLLGDGGLIGVGLQAALVEDVGAVEPVELDVDAGQLGEGAGVAWLAVERLLESRACAIEVAVAGAQPGVLDVRPGDGRVGP